MQLLRGRVFYGWVVVAVASLVIMGGAGTRAAPGALLLGIEADTGWSRGTIALAAAGGLLLLGLGGPLSGVLIDRFGVRRVVTGALALAAAGMGLSAAVTEVWQLVLVFGLMTGLGGGLLASSLSAVIANRWFERRRGFVIGVLGGSMSAGQLVFFPLLTGVAVLAGWRVSALFLAGLLALLAIPALVFLRETPGDVGERPLGATEATPTEPLRSEPGIMQRALRSPEFWLLAGTFFVCGATSNGLVGQHFIAHAVDHGFTAVAASGALAVMGAFNFIGTIASGWLTDRFDPRRLLLVYYALRGLSLLYLPAIHDSLDVVAFSVLFGLDYIATVPPTVMLVAETFGRRNVGVVYGWVFAAHMLGAAIAAWAAGVVRDSAGDYAIAFIAAGWMAVGAGVVALMIRRSTPTPSLLPAAVD